MSLIIIPPQKIANVNSKSYELIKRKSKGNFLVSDFSKLNQLAKTTIGHSN